MHDNQLEVCNTDLCMQAYVYTYEISTHENMYKSTYGRIDDGPMAARLFRRACCCEDLLVDLEDDARGAWRRMYSLAPAQELRVAPGAIV